MMSDTTAKYLRKLNTGISGDKRKLWADADFTKGTPPTLHGYPVIINNDMSDVEANGLYFTGISSPVAFGDFSKFVVRQAENNSTLPVSLSSSRERWRGRDCVSTERLEVDRS